MKSSKPIFTLGLVAFILAFEFGCQNKSDQSNSTQPLEIPVVKVIQKDLPIYEWYVGQIFGQKDIPIRARVDGFLESMNFKEGSAVKKGQLLYTIDPQSLEEATNAQKSKVSEAQTKVTKAQADLNRIKPLAEANAVSKSDLDAAQANYDAAVANLKATQANLRSANINLSYTQVLSPIDGIIGTSEASVGEYVGQSPNPVILNTVSEISTVVVKFSIPEAMFIKLAKSYDKNQQIKTDSMYRGVQLQLSDGSIYDYKGTIDFINRNIDQSTGSILVQASFLNPNGLLRPGLYSKVRVLTGVSKDAIIVPQRCLIETQGIFSVFTVNDSNIIESKAIKISYKTGDIAAVSEGLEPNDRIVIDALQKVRKDMKVLPVETQFESNVFNKNN